MSWQLTQQSALPRLGVQAVLAKQEDRGDPRRAEVTGDVVGRVTLHERLERVKARALKDLTPQSVRPQKVLR